ncbi:MAG: TetR/AcrR family transcriptional regulator [Tateyamaria sp.]|jgi:AcrR family transcriptional regulator|nr:TetR/AcrR family transcriptional regulator [Tateyamaria sp.]MDG1336837.1 TetR/AcrR family transcriptional regulator [Tateyamaria sp.]MDG2057744.1 TetR/AcrR family transcriptional regulator [Tateyamaria sp.]
MARTTGSHSDITGPRVRAAALRLFARHGFAAVSMRQIAMEVGVQVGALYNYTPDKQTLLFELMRDHMIELLRAAVTFPRDMPLADLENFVRFHIAFHHHRPDAVFIAYMELRNLEPDNFAEIEALRGQYEAVLESILEAGRFNVADRKIATLAIIAMLTGVSTWFRTGGRLSLGAVQEQYWEMVRRMVGPEGGSV